MATQLSAVNRLKLSYMEEADFGVTPDTGNEYALRLTGESLNFSYTKESSNELNPARGVSNVVPLDAEAAGDINTEMSYAEYDRFMAATLQDTWGVYGTDGVSDAMSLTVDASGNTISGSPTGSDEFDNLKPGQWFTLEDSAGNTKLLRVATSTKTEITVDSNFTLTNDTLSNAKIRTSRLVNGADQKSFSIQREISDVGEYFLFKGMTPDVMTLDIASGAFTTMGFTFMGKRADADDSSLFVPASPGSITKVPSFNYQGMSSVNGSSCIMWVDGKPLSGTFVQSISLNYNNQSRARQAICTLGAISIGAGQIECTIDLEVYFASGRTFYEQMLDNSDLEVAFSSFDPVGNGYVYTMPRGNVSDYTLNGDGGNDSDLMASVTVTGLLDPNNVVLAIDRVGAAVDLS